MQSMTNYLLYFFLYFFIFLLVFFSIERDIIVALLPIVLDIHKAPHLTYFIDFLHTLTGTSNRITLDQWDSFLLFNSTVKVDLSDYDENGACKCYIEYDVIYVFYIYYLLLFSRANPVR